MFKNTYLATRSAWYLPLVVTAALWVGCVASSRDDKKKDKDDTDIGLTADVSVPDGAECSPAMASYCDGQLVMGCSEAGALENTDDCQDAGLVCSEGECVTLAFDCATIKPLKLIVNKPTLSSIALAFAVDTCDGDPVVGLTDADFEITEDEKPISKTEAQATIVARTSEVYISLVMDNSPSVQAAGALDAAVDAALVFVDEVMSGIQTERVWVSVSFFSKKLVLQQDYTTDKELVKAALEALRTDTTGSNTTNLYGAIVDTIAMSEQVQEARESAMRGGVMTLGQVVLFTDGSDQAALYSLEDAMAALASTDDDVITIAFGGEVEKDVLDKLGKNGSYLVDSADELTNVFVKAGKTVKALQKRVYILGYCSPKLAGVHQLQIALKGDKGQSTPIEFDATPFNSDAATCSTALFEAACDGKSCGGLLCGACDEGVTCLNDDRCACDFKVCGTESGLDCGSCAEGEYCGGGGYECKSACNGLGCGPGLVPCFEESVGSDCCEPHGTPGCSDAYVAGSICDAFGQYECCEIEWTPLCAAYAQEYFPESCGTNVDPWDLCVDLSVSCGQCGEGAYCLPDQSACADACDGLLCGLSPIDGQSCGECPADKLCSVDQSECVSPCDGLVCGPSPLDGTDCGQCGPGKSCSADQSECVGTVVVEFLVNGDSYADTESTWWLEDLVGDTWIDVQQADTGVESKTFSLPLGTYVLYVADSIPDGGIAVKAYLCDKQVAEVSLVGNAPTASTTFTLTDCDEPNPCNGLVCGSANGMDCGSCPPGTVCDATQTQCKALPEGDACTNPSDQVLAANGSAQDLAQDCALCCLAEPDGEGCTKYCIQFGLSVSGCGNGPSLGLSSECGDCYADSVLCSIQSCIPACLSPNSAACKSCLAMNCSPAFYECSGLEDCSNGADDNANGLVDCDDSVCQVDLACGGNGDVEVIILDDGSIETSTGSGGSTVTCVNYFDTAGGPIVVYGARIYFRTDEFGGNPSFAQDFTLMLSANTDVDWPLMTALDITTESVSVMGLDTWNDYYFSSPVVVMQAGFALGFAFDQVGLYPCGTDLDTQMDYMYAQVAGADLDQNGIDDANEDKFVEVGYIDQSIDGTAAIRALVKF